MKTIKLFSFMLASAALLASCSNSAESSAETTEATAEVGAPATYNVIPTESNVRWECGTAGATVYSHFGSIQVAEGMISTEGDKIVGGNFSINMSTITPQDNGYSEEHPASDLVGHLSSPDFFDVANFPVAIFRSTSVEGNSLMGELTVRGKTNTETVTIDAVTVQPDGSIKASGTLVFDRQKYDVKWAHYLKDVILNNDIVLNIELTGKKA